MTDEIVYAFFSQIRQPELIREKHTEKSFDDAVQRSREGSRDRPCRASLARSDPRRPATRPDPSESHYCVR